MDIYESHNTESASIMSPIASAPSETTGTEGSARELTHDVDVEKGAVADVHLENTTVQSISWRNITVTVEDRETKLPKAIIDKVEGIVEAGASRPTIFPTSQATLWPHNSICRRDMRSHGTLGLR